MALIFGDAWFDFGQFEDLMPEGFQVVAGEGLSATSAMGRFQGDHFGHLFRGNQGSLMFGVPFLSAPLASRGFAFGNRLLGMGMLAGGRQR